MYLFILLIPSQLIHFSEDAYHQSNEDNMPITQHALYMYHKFFCLLTIVDIKSVYINYVWDRVLCELIGVF